jgi:hypothetical protein
MNTDDLIRALANDHAVRPEPVARRFALLSLLGFLAGAGLLAALLGPRPDLAEVLASPPVLFKFLVALSLAGAAGVVAFRFAKPDAKPSFGAALAVPLLLLTMGIAAELAISPAASWRPLLVGQNAGVCLVLIPLFSLPPLLAALTGLRHGAPSRPRLAGAAAGLFAGGLGAALWAMHCTDDSPLFVAAWYAPAVAIVAFAGAALGVRMLRW